MKCSHPNSRRAPWAQRRLEVASLVAARPKQKASSANVVSIAIALGVNEFVAHVTAVGVVIEKNLMICRDETFWKLVHCTHQE